MTSINNLQTFQYKRLEDGAPVYVDVHVPESFLNNKDKDSFTLPAVIDFHAGGFTVGDKANVPGWLLGRVLDLGYLVISPDYQLVPSSTGHDIIKDTQDLMSYLSTAEFRFDGTTFGVNFDLVAFSGSSAGGMCALLAAMNCSSPKPKAIFSLYGVGGNVLTPFYFQPKTEPFLGGSPLLDVSIYEEYVYPFPKKLPRLSSAPFSFSSPLETNIRAPLHLLYLQLGAFLDGYTGQHDPSLSKIVRNGVAEGSPLEDLIPQEHRVLLPQFGEPSLWPPIMWMHGTADVIVPFSEAIYFVESLRAKGVNTVELIPIEGEGHGFDNSPDAEKLYGVEFDGVKDFLSKHLG